MDIVISGYYGFDNAGDELILLAMLLDLRRLLPGVRIVVLSNNPDKTFGLHQVTAIPRWNILRVTRAVGEADILISGGGGLLQDVTNKYSILYYLGIICLGELFRKKTVIYAQGIGPIKGLLNRILTQMILNRTGLITVRDEDSKRLLEHLGIKRKITVTADPTLGLKPDTRYQLPDTSYHSPLTNQQSPVIGICARRWEDFTGEAIARAADYLVNQKNARIIFIPFHLPDDFLFSQRIKNMMGEEAKIELYRQPQDLISVFSQLALVLSMRLHGLILAGLYGVPMIGVSADPKIASFIQTLGQEEVGVDVRPDHLIGRIEAIWQRREFFTHQIRSRLPALQQKAKLTAQLVKEYIGEL